MSNATDEFWAHRKARAELEEQITKQVTAAQIIVGTLNGYGARDYSGASWQWVQMIGGGNIPQHIMDSPLELNVNAWPDIRKLSDLISQWHALDWDYRQAWVRMSGEEKDQMRAHEPEEHQAPRSNRY